MYESFFQMNRRPFRAVPHTADYFPAATIETARQTLVRCIERAEGAGLLIGPSGTGKTLFCLMLTQHFRDTYRVVHLANGRFSTPRALLQAILYELGRPYRKMEEGELRLSLIDYATSSDHCPNGILLLVDEAHSLPLRQLEEIRMITNLVRDGQPRVRLVLVGGPDLEERLANPNLEALNQRLAARCYLEAFTREETHDYVRGILKAVEAESQSVFSDDALDAVFTATDGIPRFVNQVCDHALVLAFAGGHEHLEQSGIEEAWSDLQQLPTPWNESEQRNDQEEEAECSIIEFGHLDDSEPEQARPELGEVDEEFHPAGAIGPETEVVLDDSGDPFGEEFAEEEVLIDRFTALEVNGPLSSTRVASQEGRELSERLQPFLDREVRPHLCMAEDGDDHSTDPGAESAESGQPSVVGQSPDDETIEPSVEDIVDIPSDGQNQTEDEGTFATDDLDVLVVEEDPQPTTSVPIHSGRERRRAYRQLFAKLRRG